MISRGFPPTPRGYYAIAFSEDVAIGATKNEKAFGRDLVVFRGASGRASVVDAYCAHLGAHLGEGGKVVGDCIECPFHRWRFAGDGGCEGIPYATRIPARARLDAFVVREQDGVVFVAHGDLGAVPLPLPHPAVLDEPDMRVLGRRAFELAAHPQDLIENIVDIAHFPALHAAEIPELELAFDGPTMRVGFDAAPILLGRARPSLPSVRVDITAIGLTHVCVRTRYPGLADIALLQYATPIDGDRHLLRQRFVGSVGDGVAGIPRRALAYVATLASILASRPDRRIWAHKIYRSRPLLCDGDGPIGPFREWASQFYDGGVRAGANVAPISSDPP